MDKQEYLRKQNIKLDILKRCGVSKFIKDPDNKELIKIMKNGVGKSYKVVYTTKHDDVLSQMYGSFCIIIYHHDNFLSFPCNVQPTLMIKHIKTWKENNGKNHNYVCHVCSKDINHMFHDDDDVTGKCIRCFNNNN